MNKLFYKNLLAFSLIVAGLFFLTHTSFAQGEFFDSLNNTAKHAGVLPENNENANFSLMVGNILRGLFGLLGTVFLVLVMYGGFIWMTASGNDESVNKAKKIITQATIGLFVMVLAYALTDFIFGTIISSTQIQQSK